MALNMRAPSPVWKKSSPIRRKSGIGTNAKEVSAPKPLLSMRTMPRSPPMKTQAPRMLAARKASATGIPSAISMTMLPSSRASALNHSTRRLPSAERGHSWMPASPECISSVPRTKRENSIAIRPKETGKASVSHHLGVK